MCLNVSKPYSKPRKGKGYKVFVRKRDGIYADCMSSVKWSPYIPKEWNTAVNCKIIDFNGREYESGFHIFTTLKDAKFWRESNKINREIREVEYEDARTFGTQETPYLDEDKTRLLHCVVAQKMKVGKIVVRVVLWGS